MSFHNDVNWSEHGDEPESLTCKITDGSMDGLFQTLKHFPHLPPFLCSNLQLAAKLKGGGKGNPLTPPPSLRTKFSFLVSGMDGAVIQGLIQVLRKVSATR